MNVYMARNHQNEYHYLDLSQKPLASNNSRFFLVQVIGPWNLVYQNLVSLEIFLKDILTFNTLHKEQGEVKS